VPSQRFSCVTRLPIPFESANIDAVLLEECHKYDFGIF